ncbi:hypothetical protein E4T75_10110 [Staphylococcus saprophyticus]|nr:hypothetical protein E4T75_10110 [Staphylococcus saprophyticus]
MGVNMEEIWKDIEGYEGLYMVSSHGRVWGCKRKIIMKQRCNRDGYLKIGLRKNGGQKTFLSHRLVSLAFLPHVEGKKYVNHVDENKTNNRLNNLEWCTARENNMHGTRTEKAVKKIKQTRKERNPWENAVRNMSIPIVGINKDDIVFFKSMNEAGRKGYCDSHISSCINGKRKTHKGYKWYKQSDFEQKERKQCI